VDILLKPIFIKNNLYNEVLHSKIKIIINSFAEDAKITIGRNDFEDLVGGREMDAQKKTLS
jgi:hypothetical protein